MALRAGPRKPSTAAAAPRKWESITRTWTGIIAALILAVCSLWLLSTYIHARSVEAADKATVESLKEKAKSDAEIQKILQPELDRQHKAAVARRNVYNRGGALLLISSAVFVTWFRGFRPKQGTGAGAPAMILKYLEKPPERRPKISRKPTNESISV